MTRVCLLLALLAASAAAQKKLDPIQWKADAAPVGVDGSVVVKLTVTMESGWHLYSLTTPRPPIASTIKPLDETAFADGVEAFQPAPVRKRDPNFGVDTETFAGDTVFYFRGQLKAPDTKQTQLQVRYQACDDTQCLPPRKKTIDVPLEKGTVLAVPAGFTPAAIANNGTKPNANPLPPPEPQQELGQFLALAFGLGLASIFTPCVFPMIPLTMSHFLNLKAGRVGQAILFCLGIIVLFTALGLGLTAILGPAGVRNVAANPWVNGTIALIFLALGLSLMGAFELTIPSSILTPLNAASSGGGSIATILMGLTFALSSFACVGPFVGTLLAGSVTGGTLQPTLGMMSFASGLALPFFGLALFPGLLGKMPRSGGWLMRVKIVMGFCVLALMFKYLANVDVVLGWNLLTRERFLAAWFVLFALPGLYLLGLLRMEGIKAEEDVSLPRLLTASAFLIFALSLLPGMFGSNLGELEGMIPAPRDGYGAFNKGGEGLKWHKNDLPAALAQAKSEGKLVFVNFTGYTCTNCHWMKANMFTRPEVIAAMKNFVLVELYTDDPNEAVAEANQKLQEERVKTVALPYYLVVNADDQIQGGYPRVTRDPAEWLKFLGSFAKQS